MVKGFTGFLTLVVLMFTGGPTHASDLLELNPPRVVVKYGDSVSVDCSTSSTDVEGMGWEVTEGGTDFEPNVRKVTWNVNSLKDWTIKPICYITTTTGQDTKTLPVILYKIPDNISISLLNHSGPMVEGTEYHLQCDIQNVAPLQNLVVKWYKGNEFLINVTYSNSMKTPVDVSPTLIITPSRDDDGAQYRCEAELDLGPEGPQPPPTMSSEALNITVHYPPTLGSEAEIVGIRVGEEISLNCTATGRPAPHYSWNSSLHIPNNSKNKALLTPSSELPGNYTCIASNHLGSISKMFIVTPTQEVGRTTFWAVILSALSVALVIGVGYVILKRKLGPNTLI